MANRLPLNWMDRALLAQTYEGRPMTTHHAVVTETALNREALESAARAIARETPVLRSRTSKWIFRWSRVAVEPEEERFPVLTWLKAPALRRDFDGLSTAFDLRAAPPWRLLRAPHESGGDLLVLSLHHSVTDGLGAWMLFDALLRAYDRASGFSPPAPEPIAIRGARFRDLVRTRGLRFAAALGVDTVRQIPRFGDRRAHLLDAPRAVAGPTRVEVLLLDEGLWARAAETARRRGVQRNDLMMAAALRSASEWRRARGLPDEAFRVLVPVSLRREMNVGRAVQNHVGVAQIDCGPGEVEATDLAERLAERSRTERRSLAPFRTPLLLATIATSLPAATQSWIFRRIDESSGAFPHSFLFSNLRLVDAHVPLSAGIRSAYCWSTLPRQPGIGFTITQIPGKGASVALAWQEGRSSENSARELIDRMASSIDEMVESRVAA